MGNDQHRTGIIAQVLFQPLGGLGVEVVGRFVKQQKVGLFQQQAAQRHAAALATRQVGDLGVARRALQRVHGHLDLLLQVPQVQPIHFVLQLADSSAVSSE